MMGKLLNLEYLAGPMNWIFVALTVAFFAVAVAVLANGGRLPE
jgi:hypothetical protein